MNEDKKMKKNIKIAMAVLTTMSAITVFNFANKDSETNKYMNKTATKKQEVNRMETPISVTLKKPGNEVVETVLAPSEELELKALGKKIDKKTKRLKNVIANMHKIIQETPIDKDKFKELENEYMAIGAQIKNDIISFQKLSWSEMNQVDPYKNEYVQHWKANK